MTTARTVQNRSRAFQVSPKDPGERAARSSRSREDSMTHISTIATLAAGSAAKRRPALPTLGIGASLAVLCGSLGRAFTLAYVDPYAERERRPEVAPGDGEAGRDPSW